MDFETPQAIKTSTQIIHITNATFNPKVNVAFANTTLDFKVAMFILFYSIIIVNNYGERNYA
jgi:hypothetical protein